MKFNLLPSPPPPLRTRVWIFTLITACLMAVCAYLGASWYQIQAVLTADRLELQVQSETVSALRGKVTATQATVARTNTIEKIQQLQRQVSNPANGVATLVQVLGSNGRLTGLSYANNQFTGVFEAPSLARAAALIRELQATKTFQSVSITNVASPPGGSTVQLSFTITLASRASSTQMAGDGT